MKRGFVHSYYIEQQNTKDHYYKDVYICKCGDIAPVWATYSMEKGPNRCRNCLTTPIKKVIEISKKEFYKGISPCPCCRSNLFFLRFENIKETKDRR